MKKRNKEKCEIICKSRPVAESGNSDSVSWLSQQFSIRDQGDLAKLELRLSIITILYELTNALNYTGRNIFVYQEAKVCFFSHLGNIQLSQQHDFLSSTERPG